MSTIMYIRVPRRGMEHYFREIREAHLEAFGIHRALFDPLYDAFHKIRTIEQKEGSELDWLERILSMCFDTATPEMKLPYNQCFRFQLLLLVLAELADMEDIFGSGFKDE